MGSDVFGMGQGRVEPFPEVSEESLQVCIHYVGSCREMPDKRPESQEADQERSQMHSVRGEFRGLLRHEVRVEFDCRVVDYD